MGEKRKARVTTKERSGKTNKIRLFKIFSLEHRKGKRKQIILFYQVLVMMKYVFSFNQT
jgi:hypothetical protein